MSEDNPSVNPTPAPGTLVVPKHGRGMIRHGSDTPGPGRPSSAIRKTARESLDKRMGFLDRVIDGEMIEHRVQAPGAAEPMVIRRSADLADRMRAFRELREMGLGTLKELNSDDVRDRLTLQIQTIATELPRLVRDMSPGATTVAGKVVLPLETPEDVAEALLKMVEQCWV